VLLILVSNLVVLVTLNNEKHHEQIDERMVNVADTFAPMFKLFEVIEEIKQ